MSAAAMVGAAQTILTAVAPGVTVYDYAPKTVRVDPLIYVQHRAYSDLDKSPGVIQRTHEITVRLMMKTTSDDHEGVEQAFLALADAVANAFYPHRNLNGTASRVDVAQEQSGDYLWYQNVEYRQREWTIRAVEYLTFTFS